MYVGVLQFASYGGLAFATCEIILTLKEEIKYIWTNPGRFTLVKLLYLISRYFALAAHIVNTVLATLVHGHPHAHTPERTCRYTFIYRAIVIFVLLGLLDAILMIQVYALYNRRTCIAVFLFCLLVSKVAAASSAAYIGFPHQRFSPSCLVITGSQPSLYLFAVGELVVQLTIVGLTLSRHFSAERGGWSTPILSLVARQGSMLFSCDEWGHCSQFAASECHSFDVPRNDSDDVHCGMSTNNQHAMSSISGSGLRIKPSPHHHDKRLVRH
ncbi:hypothetical protein B0H11DRAFT_389297 [Mycena galericulata]|nr:hypothetical protein B0H11DRAFT_389297 [Mycena galericulata]